MTSESIDTAISWLEYPPDFLGGINAIIFLSYKPVGRCPDYELLLKNSNHVQKFFRFAVEKHAFKIGFDSCSVSGIAAFTQISSACYDACDAARFSMFVSEDLRMYPCSFMVEAGYKGVPIAEDNMLTTWQSNELFTEMRDKLTNGSCKGCTKKARCLGGCPIFGEINLCKH